jgi:Asp-tRNA(Asn)/Glu-tRNA(Gln) amidotransferase A subunit family amidase
MDSIILEPFRLTASQARALMQKGDLTVEDYAKSLLSRIKARDDVVKAWAYLDPEYVIAQARKLDQIPPEERGPLHGVPIGVKDVILTKGTYFILLLAFPLSLLYRSCLI